MGSYQQKHAFSLSQRDSVIGTKKIWNSTYHEQGQKRDSYALNKHVSER
jgi:hypothetical protein